MPSYFKGNENCTRKRRAVAKIYLCLLSSHAMWNTLSDGGEWPALPLAVGSKVCSQQICSGEAIRAASVVGNDIWAWDPSRSPVFGRKTAAPKNSLLIMCIIISLCWCQTPQFKHSMLSYMRLPSVPRTVDSTLFSMAPRGPTGNFRAFDLEK